MADPTDPISWHAKAVDWLLRQGVTAVILAALFWYIVIPMTNAQIDTMKKIADTQGQLPTTQTQQAEVLRTISDSVTRIEGRMKP